MKKRTSFSVMCAAVVATLFAGVVPAHAVYDSGVQSRACGGQYGRLSVNLSPSSANTWAPGDWNTNGGLMQHNPAGPTWRTVVDHQNLGSGGGYWRIYTGGSVAQVSPGCSAAG